MVIATDLLEKLVDTRPDGLLAQLRRSGLPACLDAPVVQQDREYVTATSRVVVNGCDYGRWSVTARGDRLTNAQYEGMHPVSPEPIRAIVFPEGKQLVHRGDNWPSVELL
jgi:hypothetical protein